MRAGQPLKCSLNSELFRPINRSKPAQDRYLRTNPGPQPVNQRPDNRASRFQAGCPAIALNTRQITPGQAHWTRSWAVCTRACISLTMGIARVSAFCSVCPGNDSMITRTAAIGSPFLSRMGIVTVTVPFSFP